jgi:long-chain acyl-CoA synthetase
VRVANEQAHQILTVAQLIDAVRPSGGSPPSDRAEQSWDVLLNNATAPEPGLQRLLEKRPFAVPFFFVLARVLRIILGPGHVRGLANLPPNGPFIISPNHQGYLDPVIVCAVLPYPVMKRLFFVGAAEYFETRFTSWFARKINLLPVDPDANLVSAMQASAFGLKRGMILMLFPEGERSIDGTVKRFKKGAPILAQHLEVPIVPVAIRGSFELWPRNRTINWRAVLPLRRHRVRVMFGPPMRFARASEYSASATQLRERVEAMWTTL